MRLPVSILFSLLLLLPGCPDKLVQKAPQPKTLAAKQAPAEPAPEIKPLELGELVEEPLKEVVAKLNLAHYDAEALGLKGLEGNVEFTSKKLGLLARAKVIWKSGSTPEVTLSEVEKDGKKIPAPTGDQPDEIGRAIGWSDLQYKILKLVEGLGNGYLAHRLLEWKEAKGTAKLTKKALIISLDQNKQGKVVVKVGPGYEVRKVEAIHPKGFTRAMTYEVQRHNGRNLVTGALLTAEAHKGAELHKRAKMMLKAIHNTRFEIGYGDAGRYLLPVKLRKVIPSMREEMTMAITYSKVWP